MNDPGSRTQFATELGIISALRVKVESVSNGSDGDGANGGSDDSRSLHGAGMEEGREGCGNGKKLNLWPLSLRVNNTYGEG